MKRKCSTPPSLSACRFCPILLIALVIIIAMPRRAHAIGQERYVTFSAKPGDFPLAQGNDTATLFVDPQDWPGVVRAAGDLQSDIERVTGHKPDLAKDAAGLKGRIVIAGTLGKSPILDQLAKAGKINPALIAGKWESFFIETVDNPLPGVANALVIAGSDKRGTIYGIYDLSEQIGVSPWYWWADVPAQHHDALFIRAGRYEQGEPSVKYRGIFINDEAPDLTNWVHEKYGTVQGLNGVANYNHEFYSHVFELLLRLKANYLWPAMWNNAFNEDDPENPRLADEYGIVMGTSHQEPMLRAQKEWDHRHRQSWNYYTDATTLQDFWREGVRRNKNYESILTIGLRGANDTPMIPNGTMQESMDLLKKIIAEQRTIIGQEVNPDVTKVPQLWCPYKEVLDYYNAGFRVPDDVTILWTDDNWGNIRRLPTAEERQRPGGAGIYYHFDYVGGPRNYKWINTNPLPKIWEEMSMAKAYGADRIWIVNVGHLKGLELPIEYFMNLAWNSPRWTNQNIGEFTQDWAGREFGADHANQITRIISEYTKYNGRRKPELLEPGTYSLANYQEFERAVAQYESTAGAAEELSGKLPKDKQDAFYELVQFPPEACSQVNALYLAAAKNALFAKQARARTNDMADEVGVLFNANAKLMDEYNHTLAGGKWNHFMDQVHIGYTIWQDPPRNVMPRVTRITVPPGAAMGVAVEGSESAWPGPTDAPSLPRFDSVAQDQHWIDLFRRGKDAFTFSAKPDQPWIITSTAGGKLDADQRLAVSIDWAKLPLGSSTGSIAISRLDDKNAPQETVNVKVEAFNPREITRDTLDGFAETNGYVSIEAEHFTKKSAAGDTHWEKIEDYGRTLSAMTILPMTAPSITAPTPANSPSLEYKMYLFDSGDLHILSVVAPSLNIMPGRGLRYALSFDDQPPQVITIVPADFNAQNGNRDWETTVKDNARLVRSAHHLAAPGYHTLKVWMVDPGVVLEKIVVDLGGVKPCYLGPPESFHRTPGHE